MPRNFAEESGASTLNRPSKVPDTFDRHLRSPVRPASIGVAATPEPTPDDRKPPLAGFLPRAAHPFRDGLTRRYRPAHESPSSEDSSGIRLRASKEPVEGARHLRSPSIGLRPAESIATASSRPKRLPRTEATGAGQSDRATSRPAPAVAGPGSRPPRPARGGSRETAARAA